MFGKYPDLIKNLDLHKLNCFGPISYQLDLWQLVKDLKPMVVVETGTRYGVATALILDALPEDGHLYSCDVVWASQPAAEQGMKALHGTELDPARWTYYAELSMSALPKVPEGEWDLFVHDSAHDKGTVAWELAFAWERLSPGGIIVCDDWETCAGAAPHRAFLEFCEHHGLEHTVMGSAAWVRKPWGDDEGLQAAPLSPEAQEALDAGMESEGFGELEELGEVTQGRVPSSVGEIIVEEFGGKAEDFEGDMRAQVSALIAGKGWVSPDVALALAERYGTTAEFWLNLQREYYGKAND